MSWKSLFTWRVPEHGFEWVHLEDSPDQLLVPRLVPIGGMDPKNLNLPVREYSPLLEHTGLSRTCADIRLSEEGILQFANRYGALRPRLLLHLSRGRDQKEMGFSDYKAGSLAEWRREIVTLRQAIKLWDRAQAGDRAELARFIEVKLETGGIGVRYRSHPELSEKEEQDRAPENEHITTREFLTSKLPEGWQEQLKPGDVVTAARLLVKLWIEENLKEGLSAKIALLPESPGMAFGYVPADLLTAMWLQFALGTSEGKEYRSCAVCGTWYELSPDTARTTRLFCSDSCKSRGYRQKQDRARQLFSEKNTFRQIAKELGSDVATVKRWITGKKA